MGKKDERTPPDRIRLTGLQEQQIEALTEIERATAAMYHALGFDAATVPARNVPDIVALTRKHNVHVAEADRVVAGYLAWRDEAPGVAYVEELCVHPDFHRFGIGSRLLEKAQDEAREAGLGEM